MDDLFSLRRQIDETDDALIPLLRRRMALSAAVGAYKTAHGLPVLDENREQQIRNKVALQCGEEGDAVEAVYAAILEASRAIQQCRNDGTAQ